ncbi:MAG TPA: ComF family protein [Candidatus Saccharimonadales bacterium]|nr:ComF family protein [Candidatus Saccharimonadales bacterium]
MLVADHILSLIAPHYCLGCGVEGAPLCPDCLSRQPTKRPTCYRCNKLSPGGRTCPACRRQTKLAGVVVASYYEGVVKELVQALKYQNQVAAAQTLATLITPLLSPTAFDCITAIPGAPSRYRRRGYHQAELIAKAIARATGLPYRPLLGRLEVASQVGISRRKRLEQVRGSFIVRRSALVEGQRILIIDDVLTTGATLSEAALVLKSAGAKSVWGAVAAKH